MYIQMKKVIAAFASIVIAAGVFTASNGPADAGQYKKYHKKHHKHYHSQHRHKKYRRIHRTNRSISAGVSVNIGGSYHRVVRRSRPHGVVLGAGVVYRRPVVVYQRPTVVYRQVRHQACNCNQHGQYIQHHRTSCY